MTPTDASVRTGDIPRESSLFSDKVRKAFMKKDKFIFKIGKSNRGKVYIGHKWLKDVTEVKIHGLPFNFTVEIEQYKRNSDGKYVIDIDNNEIERKTKIYKFNRDMV